MPFVPVTVELPQYALSFVVNAPLGGSVRDLKTGIALTCPGRPPADGQRLIHRGRFLLDHEELDNLWKPDETRVVHLAVNPNAWSEAPPEMPGIPAATPSTEMPQSFLNTNTNLSNGSIASAGLQRRHSDTVNPPTPLLLSTSSRSSIAPHHSDSLQFIAYTHFKALRCLSSTIQVPGHAALEEPGSKAFAQAMLQAMGCSWPPIFDEAYPQDIATYQPVEYTYSVIEGKPYLQLLSPMAIPSPTQQHAIRVLSYTLPLLSIRTPAEFTTTRTETTNVNQPHRAVRVRVLELRNLFAPLVLLVLRTLLLLYFFSPARKPLFSVLLAFWVLYEAWGAIRGAFVDLNEFVADLQQGRNGAGQGENVVNAGGDQQGRRRIHINTSEVVLSRVARMNLGTEERALAAEDIPEAREPGFLSKTWSFISLFALTLHPGMWNRRRTALREREGRIRNDILKRRETDTEEQGVGDRTPESNGERQILGEIHEQRRPWVKEYIERVDREEWVDE